MNKLLLNSSAKEKLDISVRLVEYIALYEMKKV